MRDDHFAVHLDCQKSRGEAVAEVYDLEADPHERANVAGKHADVAGQAVERVEAIAGPLPLVFDEYEPHCEIGRLQTRIMNTFAPMRWPDK